MKRYTLAGIFLLLAVALVEWNALCSLVFIVLAAVCVRRKSLAKH